MNPIKQFREFYLADARRYLDDIQFDKLLKKGIMQDIKLVP